MDQGTAIDNMFKKLCLVFLLASFPQLGFGKSFKNSYIEFRMPDQWQCHLKERAWLCRHRVSTSCKKNRSSEDCKEQIKKSREAVIVVAAKQKSSIDSLKAFSDHFGTAKPVKAPGRSSQSKVIHNKIVGIRQLKWVDGMHLSSELPHYYTRYLSTIKGDVAVLVSFTAHKKFYTKYSSDFFKGIKSLNVTATQLSKVDRKELGKQILSHPIDLPDELFGNSGKNEPGGRSDSFSYLLFMFSMVLAAVGVFIWFKKKK